MSLPAPKKAATPREAAEGSEFVIVMVSNDEASRNVWLDATNGALKDMQSGAIAIESSTLTPAWVRVLAGAMSEAGGALLDAPVAEHSHVRRTADNVGIIAPNYNVAIR